MSPIRHRQRGMVALLLLVLLVTAALAVVMRRPSPANDRDLAAREATAASLARVQQALNVFAMQNRRLPCPALGLAIASQAESDRGVERRRNDASVGYDVCRVSETDATLRQEQTHGVVPWRTLGLKRADVLDGWGNLLTYRVFPDLVRDAELDITECHPDGTVTAQETTKDGRRCKPCTGAAANCTPPHLFTLGWGLQVTGPGGAILMNPSGAGTTNNGAAYLVISHGENGAGAYSADGIAVVGRPVAGSNEGANAATAKFAPWTASGVANALPVFRDAAPSQVEGTAYFDDLLLRPSILEVIYAARLGPRKR